MIVKSLVVVCLFLHISSGICSLVPYITKCAWDDSKCLKESSQSAIPIFAGGIPEFNVGSMEPLTFDKIDLSSSNLKLMLTDVRLSGHKRCTAEKIKRDIQKSRLFIVLKCSIDMEAKYNMDGKLFVLPIKGDGDARAKIRDNVITIDAELTEKVGKDGKKHWFIKSFKHTFEPKGQSDIKFDNLFPNDEFLRNSMNEFIAKNGNNIIMEVGPAIMQVIVTKAVENVNHYFNKVPTEDLALD